MSFSDPSDKELFGCKESMEPPPKKVVKLSEAPTPVERLPSPDVVITEKDLPLLANIGDVRVRHYLMKLSTNFLKKVVNGTVILFLEWSNPSQKKIILDQCFLKFKRALLLRTGNEYEVGSSLSEFDNGSSSRKYFYRSGIDWFEEHSGDSVEELRCTQNKWSLTVEGWKGDPPVVLRIDYETLETSPSIHWRPCDGFNYGEASSKCCYTPAPAVNNRGLFPCQEPPSAMATWEVLLECEKEFIPLLTSDEPGELIGDGETGRRIHYFYCSVPLPMSTFAMVVGKFYLQSDLVTPPKSSSAPAINDQSISNLTDPPESPCRHHSKYPCRFRDANQSQARLIHVRLFCLDPDTVPHDLTKFQSLALSSLTTSFNSFGPHPFSRLDIVIVPKSYPHLGLTSPSMIFLSPNNFYGVEPMYVCRVPHEICHNWFGLLIGSLDWTEEWLSEGFATYCEDVLFSSSYQTYFPHKTAEEAERDQALKILARFTSLQNELLNTKDNLNLHSISNRNSQENCQAAAINGLVPLKQFMHVHYYKGYLLLWHLAYIVGQTEFLVFLKEYVWRYHGQLVTSEIFLESYKSKFEATLCYPDFDSTMTVLKEEWLQSNKLPEPYSSIDLLGDDNLAEDSVPPIFLKAMKPLKKIKLIFQDLLRGNAGPPGSTFEKLSCSELLLLMELILKSFSDERSPEKRKVLENIYYQQFVPSTIFQDVDQRYNADVAHRWCELIIAFKDKSRLTVVEKFLRNNIAMGVYLYGELMITERYTFQKRARQLFHELQNVYDLATKKILKEMIL